MDEKMTDELINKSALFFYLLTLDDKLATEATRKALELMQVRGNKKIVPSQESEVELMLKCCLEEWFKLRPRLHKDQTQVTTTTALRWPEHLDLNPWKEFQKRAPEPELIAVACVHVLGFSEATLARCLNLTDGTIRYRIGKGLALLGQLNRPGAGLFQYS
jgi:hypothetical protein